MKNKALFTFMISILLIFSGMTLNGQNRTKKEIVNYLIKVGDLENNALNSKDIYDGIFIVDLVTRKDYKDGQTGIFSFGAFGAHNKSYILLKNDSTFTILNLKDLDADLLSEIAFLKKHKFSCDRIIKYIEYTIETDQMNQNVIPWTSSKPKN